MTVGRAAPLLLVLFLVAGCTGAVIPAPASDTPVLFASNDASGCRLGVAVLLVPFAQAKSALPAGFTPRDAQGLLGTPAPTGKAGIVLGSYHCKTADMDAAGLSAMEVNILVERPNVEGERPKSNLDYYQPVVYTSSVPLLDLLGAAGWNAIQGSSQVEVTSLATGARATSSAKDTSGAVATFESTGGAPTALSGLSRFWHDTPGGLSYFDFEVNAQVLAGSATCALRADSAVAKIAGMTTCAPGDAIGIVVPDLSWKSAFHHLPRSRAQ